MTKLIKIGLLAIATLVFVANVTLAHHIKITNATPVCGIDSMDVTFESQIPVSTKPWIVTMNGTAIASGTGNATTTVRVSNSATKDFTLFSPNMSTQYNTQRIVGGPLDSSLVCTTCDTVLHRRFIPNANQNNWFIHSIGGAVQYAESVTVVATESGWYKFHGRDGYYGRWPGNDYQHENVKVNGIPLCGGADLLGDGTLVWNNNMHSLYVNAGDTVVIEANQGSIEVIVTFCPDGTFPVELLDQTLTVHGYNTDLAFFTANEVNNSGFWVRAGIDTADMQVVGWIPSQDGGGLYEFTHTAAIKMANENGMLLYQFIQVDMDGTATRLPYMEARFDKATIEAYQAQLAQRDTRLLLNGNSTTPGAYIFVENENVTKVTICDPLGRIMGTDIPIEEGRFRVPANLDAGYYIVIPNQEIAAARIRVW